MHHFSRNFPVSHLSTLHFHHFLADFNFLHTVCILKLFSTVCQPLIMVVVFFSYTPEITPKFDTIFKIWDNSVTFFSFQFFVDLFLVDLKCWFCLNCEIYCSYILIFIFFAVNLRFSSSINRFIPFFLLYI